MEKGVLEREAGEGGPRADREVERRGEHRETSPWQTSAEEKTQFTT